jgi:glutaredoxin
VTADAAAMSRMIEHSGGQRSVPVIVENGETKIGFGGT